MRGARAVRRGKVLLWVAAATVLLVASAAAGWIGVQAGYVRLNHPSWERYPVRGLDVSNHQQSVRWERVRAAGYSFAYVKATEGGDWVDPYFTEQSEGARRAGLRVGAYHFFTFCRPGADQARNFLRTVGPPRRGDLPPVVDLEFGGNCSRLPTPAELDVQFAAFADTLRRAGFAPPVLYVTDTFVRRYLSPPGRGSSPLAGHRLWLRDIVGTPGGGCGRWAFWQFANGGRVDGVDGMVDLNAYCGDEAAFAREFGPPRG